MGLEKRSSALTEEEKRELLEKGKTEGMFSCVAALSKGMSLGRAMNLLEMPESSRQLYRQMQDGIYDMGFIPEINRKEGGDVGRIYEQAAILERGKDLGMAKSIALAAVNLGKTTEEIVVQYLCLNLEALAYYNALIDENNYLDDTFKAG